MDEDGNTPLHRLMEEQNQTETVGKVLDCDVVSEMRLCLRFVESLVRSGINVDAKNKKGETALHLAAKLGRVELCKALLDCGASPIERNNKNRTAELQPRVNFDALV